MKIISSILYLILSYSLTIFLGIIGLPTLILPSRKPAAFFITLWAKGNLFLLSVICRMKLEIIGDIPQKPVIIASKHQSAFETIAFIALLNNPAYILKKEVLLIPIIGWYLSKAGTIAIDRAGKAKAMKDMIRKCGEMLSKNRSVIIFPEGTRSAPDVRVEKYHSGIAALYKKYGDTPVIPVALNSGLVWGRNSIIKTSGTVKIKFLPAMEKKLPKQEFMDKLNHLIETETEKL